MHCKMTAWHNGVLTHQKSEHLGLNLSSVTFQQYNLGKFTKYLCVSNSSSVIWEYRQLTLSTTKSWVYLTEHTSDTVGSHWLLATFEF